MFIRLLGTGLVLGSLVLGMGERLCFAETSSSASNPGATAEADVSKAIPAAIRPLFQKAQAGDAQAQYDLGIAYTSGKGIEKDFNQGIIWLKKAAEQKHEMALAKLRRLGIILPSASPAQPTVQPEDIPLVNVIKTTASKKEKNPRYITEEDEEDDTWEDEEDDTWEDEEDDSTTFDNYMMESDYQNLTHVYLYAFIKYFNGLYTACKCADKGDPEDMLLAGELLLEINPARAQKYLQGAKDAGLKEAGALLRNMNATSSMEFNPRANINPEAIPPQMTFLFREIAKRANSGDSKAMFLMAMFNRIDDFSRIFGREMSKEESLVLLHKAADNGYVPAKRALYVLEKK